MREKKKRGPKNGPNGGKRLLGIKEAYGMARTGRMPLHHADLDEVAYRLALLGANDTMIAEGIKVSQSCVSQWRRAIPSFNAAIERGRLAADATVASSMFRKATGCTYTDQIAVKVKRGKDLEEVQIISIEKTLPPDTIAGIFWLKNRQPTLWRDREAGEEGDDKPRNVQVIFVTAPHQIEPSAAKMKDVTPVFISDPGHADD
jgi:hypothetical protein